MSELKLKLVISSYPTTFPSCLLLWARDCLPMTTLSVWQLQDPSMYVGAHILGFRTGLFVGGGGGGVEWEDICALTIAKKSCIV